MFDKKGLREATIYGENILLSEPVADNIEDNILSFVAKCVDAESAKMIRLNASIDHRFIAERHDQKLLRHLDKSTSLHEQIEDFVASRSLDAGLFWVSDAQNILCLPIENGGDSPVFLALTYAFQLFDRTARSKAEEKVASIAPLVQSHLRMVAQNLAISRRLAGTLDLLDANHGAMILFDNLGSMVLANAAARSILDAHDGLRMGPRAPVPVLLKDATRFHLALDHQIAENAVGQNGKRESTVFLIHRQEGRRPFVATIIPTPVPAGRGEPAAMLFLFDPTQQHLDHLGAICELYGLSQVEARLAQHITSGLTIDEAAVAMRIKLPTARTYLKQIFMKTDTHRQADLARLLMLSTGQIASHLRPEALH